MEYYYFKDERTVGPFSATEIMALYEVANIISEDTLIYSTETETWNQLVKTLPLPASVVHSKRQTKSKNSKNKILAAPIKADVMHSKLQTAASESFWCSSCKDWVYTRRTYTNRTVGAMTIDLSGPVDGIGLINRSETQHFCFKCERRLFTNAEEYRQQLSAIKFADEHPLLNVLLPFGCLGLFNSVLAAFCLSLLAISVLDADFIPAFFLSFILIYLITVIVPHID